MAALLRFAPHSQCTHNRLIPSPCDRSMSLLMHRKPGSSGSSSSTKKIPSLLDRILSAWNSEEPLQVTPQLRLNRKTVKKLLQRRRHKNRPPRSRLRLRQSPSPSPSRRRANRPRLPRRIPRRQRPQSRPDKPRSRRRMPRALRPCLEIGRSDE